LHSKNEFYLVIKSIWRSKTNN